MGTSMISFDYVVLVVIAILFLVEVYNKASAAIKNYQENKQSKGRPIKEIKDHLGEEDKKLEIMDGRITTIEEQMMVLKATINLTMKALLAIVRHDIDGNNKEGLKEVREDIQNFTIDTSTK